MTDTVTEQSAPEQSDGPSYIEAPATDSAVKGRIKVADEVVEKVAALAALEVEGVADMGGDLARAFESVRDRIGLGSRRANQGVNAQIHNGEVAVSLTIVVEYGHVVMDVASEVKTNVAMIVSRMLGMRVMEVNVTVDDVRLPGDTRPAPGDPAADEEPSSAA
ncbi:Asp23/Gls24 family envelope stress response protein [Nonomuraea aridisoli]|uniref:Asp23/Gls24 family envelope stress response protein n=1 Tax=Nonomuraea aridisoli TaxID=2070368 RepID=A0A2W2E963_9ACTN|nr:Asp23/Gls24 family envelope stress response protein [Nonomuraea aridisoli]PZG20816.1 Asp23/Gls24 family envelope stress response protein [Nonomuraea aridisoli]